MACHDLERSLHVTFSVLLREIRLTLLCAEFPFLMKPGMILQVLFHLVFELLCHVLFAVTSSEHDTVASRF